MALENILFPDESHSLMLYIHVPFCVRKCSYCDFLSFPRDADSQKAYLRKLCEEIRMMKSYVPPHLTISSVFLGGGTPSLLEPQWIEAILSEVYESFTLEKNAEISIECNPHSAMRYKFSHYHRAGINRLSLGLQSSINSELRCLGRVHIYEDFLKCYQSARMEGFQNISIDLMNGIPEQNTDSWKRTLKNITMLRPEHLSVYNLIIEPGTKFQALKDAGKLTLPTEEELMQMDDLTLEILEKAGYRRYEISNYAKPGYECRHNYGYWSQVPYLGFGLGASSYLSGARFSNTRDLERYLSIDMASELQHQFSKLHDSFRLLSKEQQMEEFMFLGLRRTEGVSSIVFKKRYSVELETVFQSPLTKYLTEGFLEQEGSNYRFTRQGMDLSSRILSDFLL